MKVQSRPAWVVFLLLAAAPCLAGELEPPVPPGTPTMKPLNELETRQPIFVDMLPFTISQPGSYYLAGPISTSGDGITIDSDDVTIDLNGFALQGGTGSGIATPPYASLEGVVIRNGAVSGWADWGIDLHPALGGAQGVEILDVTLRRNGNGLRLYGESLVHRCVAVYNTGIGIQTGFGSVVTDVIVRDCDTGTGLIAGGGSIVTRAEIRGNNADGVELEQGAQLRESSVGSNDGHGVDATDDGVMIFDNTIIGNGGDGIRVRARSFVRGNLCVFNGNMTDGAGIRVLSDSNRIDDNHLKSNPIGLQIEGNFNVLARNTMDGNPQNWGRSGAVTAWFFPLWTVASPYLPMAWDNLDDNSFVSP